MASGPYPDPRRGTWSVQWFNGIKWCRPVVVKKRPGWKPGDPMPKKPPPEAVAALARYTREEQAARERKMPAAVQTVAVFLETYRKAYANAREPGSTKELTNAIRKFLAWCEGKKIVRVDQVTSSACNEWITDRAASRSETTKNPIQRTTIHKERALLSAAWAQAARLKEIPENPWIAATVPGKATKKKRHSWSLEEYQRLLKVCRPWLRDLLILGCNTGLRIEALRGLEWRDLVWSKPGEKGFGWVVVRPELDKAKNGYRVPMNEAVHDLLAGRFLHKDAHAVFVLTGARKKPLGSNNISDRAIRAATIDAGLNTKDKPISSPNHHCRRTFGRWAVMGHLTGKPVPIYVVSRWFGHAEVSMTMKYLDIRDDDSTRFMLGDDSEAPEF
jgi:integrase